MVLGYASKSYCQSFALQQFTSEDGLLGSTAYSIIQDENKVIWIATDGGICKFDGHSFETLKDKNIQSEIIRFFYDSKDRIWIIDLAEKIAVWEKDTLFNFYNNTFNVNAVYEDYKNNLWFIQESSISIIKESATKELSHLSFDDPSFFGMKTVVPIDEKRTFVINRHGVHSFDDYQVSFKKFVGEAPFTNFPLSAVYDQDSIILNSTDKIYSLSLSDNSIKEIFTQWNHLFKVGIHSLFYDNEKNLWITTRDGILYIEKQKDGSTQ